MITHNRNPSVEMNTNLYTSDNQDTEMALPTFPSMEQQHSGQISRARSTSRRNIKKVTTNELVKNNMLRNRQNRRVDKLKEVTYDNIQMFLRIKAQTSHYQIKGLSRHKSCKMLTKKDERGIDEKQKKQEHVYESRQKPMMRCQSAKTTLLNKCAQLRQGIAKRKPEIDHTQDIQIEETSNYPRVIHFKKKNIFNKQNENSNRGKHPQNIMMTVNEAGKRAISQKLGNIIPQCRILTNEEGGIHGARKSERSITTNIYSTKVASSERQSLVEIGSVNTYN